MNLRWQRCHGVSAHMSAGVGSASAVASACCHSGRPIRRRMRETPARRRRRNVPRPARRSAIHRARRRGRSGFSRRRAPRRAALVELRIPPAAGEAADIDERLGLRLAQYIDELLERPAPCPTVNTRIVLRIVPVLIEGKGHMASTVNWDSLRELATSRPRTAVRSVFTSISTRATRRRRATCSRASAR